MQRYHLTLTDPTDGMTARIIYRTYGASHAIGHARTYYPGYTIDAITSEGETYTEDDYDALYIAGLIEER